MALALVAAAIMTARYRVQASPLDASDAKAIALAKTVPGVAKIERYPGDFNWQVVMWCTKGRKHCPIPPDDAKPQTFPYRVVCYCESDPNGRPRGWFIEVNLDSQRARAISGNKALENIYRLP